jgi:hypothetical protein
MPSEAGLPDGLYSNKNPNLDKCFRILDRKILINHTAIWNILQTIGICHDHLVHFGFIWYILGSFGKFWVHLVHFGFIWYILGSFGTFWVHLVHFFPIFVSCTITIWQPCSEGPFALHRLHYVKTSKLRHGNDSIENKPESDRIISCFYPLSWNKCLMTRKKANQNK